MWGFSAIGTLRKRDALDSLSASDDLESEDGRSLPEFSPETVVRSRSHAKTRRVTPSTAAVLEKKVFQNGDVLWSGNGLLKDGCVYEGEWRKGKKSGKGKITWPSGECYVGEFKAGRMEGFGTFFGGDGDVYRGYWVGDMKEGFGQRRYANGDYYEGMWKRNVQDGGGRYVWANGDEYVGECRNGVANGRGMLVKANGSRYQGKWENGVLKGSRTVETNDHSGVLCKENVRKVSADGGGVRGGSGEKAFPRICVWESDGEAGDMGCDIVDSSRTSVFYDDGVMHLDFNGITKSPTGRYCVPNKVKKPGQTVVKGHKNYELMLKLQLGIRLVLGNKMLHFDILNICFVIESGNGS